MISILITLLIIGIVWWIVQTYLFPVVAEPFRTIIVVIMAVIVIVWLLGFIGYGPGLGYPGRLR